MYFSRMFLEKVRVSYKKKVFWIIVWTFYWLLNNRQICFLLPYFIVGLEQLSWDVRAPSDTSHSSLPMLCVPGPWLMVTMVVWISQTHNLYFNTLAASSNIEDNDLVNKFECILCIFRVYGIFHNHIWSNPQSFLLRWWKWLDFEVSLVLIYWPSSLNYNNM